MAQAIPLVSVARRSSIADDGEIRHHVYLLVSGQAKFGFVTNEATKCLLMILCSGDLLGALPSAAHEPDFPGLSRRSYYLDAVSDCLVA
jgi:CRP-like cAMP-binding protein